MTDTSQTLKDHLTAGDSALADGNIPVALGHFALVLAEVPGHSRVRKSIQKMRKTNGLPANLTQADMDQLVEMVQAGAFELATNQARILLSIAPKEPLLQNILGMCLSNLGFYQPAVNAFLAATKLNPQYAEAFSNLGATLVQIGRYEKAENYLRRAISLNSRLPEPHHNLAAVLKSKGELTDALASVEKALNLQAIYPNAYNTKGMILRGLNDINAAIAAFDTGLAQAPDDADLRVNRGFTLALANRFDEAIAEVSAALPNVTDPAIQSHHYGVLLSQVGRRDDAIQAFEMALSLAPGFSEASRSLSMLKTFKAGDPMIAEMETQINDPEVTEFDRMHLGFALGKAYEDLGQPAWMFKYLAMGNGEKRNIVRPYSNEMRRQQIAEIKERFTPAFARRVADGANDSRRPIFILGMNRSGTTLVEQMLSNHSAVVGGEEFGWLDAYINRNWDKLPDMDAATAATCAGDYLDFAQKTFGEAPHFTDKLPGNFNWIGFIKALLPNARIVHMRRDPRDTCLSIYKNYFDSVGNQYAYDLRELANYYLGYEDLMGFWHQEFPGEIYDCSYEALVNDPEGEARKLLSHLSLDWEPAVLAFHNNDRAIRTASVGQVREKMYQSSVGGWQKFENELKPLLDVLRTGGALPD